MFLERSFVLLKNRYNENNSVNNKVKELYIYSISLIFDNSRNLVFNLTVTVDGMCRADVRRIVFIFKKVADS